MKHLSSERVWAYLDGELEADLKSAVERHIHVCSQCEERLSAAKVASRAIHQSLKAGVPNPRASLHEEVLSSLRQRAPQAADGTRQRAGRHRRHTNGSFRWTSAVSSAAAVVVAVGVGWYALVYHHGAANPFVDKSVAMGPVNSAATGGSSNAAASHTSTNTTGNQAGTGGTGNAAANQAAGGGVALATTGRIQTLTGDSTITVLDGNSMPLANANVAWVADGKILAETTTNANGETRKVQMTVPVDPMLQPMVSDPRLQSSGYGGMMQGIVTVVAWKTGFQPDVAYDVRVFEGGNSDFAQSLTLDAGPSDTPRLIGTGQKQTDIYSNYHLLVPGAYAAWAEQAQATGPNNAAATMQAGGRTDGANSAPTGGLDIRVLDPQGKPVAGAHVKVIAGSVVSSEATTNASGLSGVIQTPGMPDWQLAGPWNVAGAPRVASVVVWKDGYDPSVGFYQAVTLGHDRTVTVRLESPAWRRANGWDNNTDTATAITGDRVPTAVDAKRLFEWVSGQNY